MARSLGQNHPIAQMVLPLAFYFYLLYIIVRRRRGDDGAVAYQTKTTMS
jgi:hypothetical protein